MSRNSPAHLRQHWTLEAGMHFLNHGAYGACPKPVQAAQQAWRSRMEAQPVRFMARELPGLLREAAQALAQFVGARGEDLALVENATAGVNAVLRSYPWRQGDEIVLSCHAYPAVKATVRFVARQFGLEVREFEFPFPLQDPTQIVAGLRAAITPRTRMALLDHVSSPLAIIYPLRDMLAVCREHGVATLVDGAHVPGMLPLNIAELGADWYVGNCHKWLFAPRGCALLWAAPQSRDFLQPVTVSYRMEEGFPACFDWVGTRDPSAWLAITEALRFYRQMGGTDIPGRLHAAALHSARQLSAAWGVSLPAPETMFGAMVTLPVAGAASQAAADALHDALWDRFRVEVPVFVAAGRLWLRVSQQLYTTTEDIAALERAVLALHQQ